MRILVTGGAGFIGSHIVDLLIEKGFTVGVVDNLSHGKKENINQRAFFFKEDIISPKLARIFSKFQPQTVSHHAALVNVSQSLKQPLKDAQVNITGTLQVLEAAKKTQVKQVIFASSVAVYGETANFPISETENLQPISVYGVSKATAEAYVGLYSQWFTPTIFRYTNVYGPRQDFQAEGGVVAIFVSRLKNGRRGIIYGNGQQTRDFVYVKDVAAANYLVIKKKLGGIYHISTNKETSILDLYHLCQRITGKQKEPLFEPVRPGDIYRSVLENIKAQKNLGWQPKVSLDKGLEETLGSL